MIKPNVKCIRVCKGGGLDLKTLDFHIGDPSFISFFFFFIFIDRTARDTTGNRMRERGSDTQQMAPRQGYKPRAAAARTKASGRGTPALPTELNGTSFISNVKPFIHMEGLLLL